jgi:hypothetical protein
MGAAKKVGKSWKKWEKVWYCYHSPLTGTPVDTPQMLALPTIGRQNGNGQPKKMEKVGCL